MCPHSSSGKAPFQIFIDQEDPTSSSLIQEVKWELEVPGSAAVGRGEQEARRVAPRRVCACRNTAQGSLSLARLGKIRKAKQHEKQKEILQMKSSHRWGFPGKSNSQVPDTSSAWLVLLEHEGADGKPKTCDVQPGIRQKCSRKFPNQQSVFSFFKETKRIALHQALPKGRAAMQATP